MAIRLVALIVLPLACELTAGQRTTTPEAEPVGRIGGRIVQKGAGTSLAKATVTLVRVDGKSAQEWSVSSDQSGVFEFASVHAGVFRLFAVRPLYLKQEYGAHKPHEAGTAITLRSGEELHDLTLSLIPESRIQGRILDPDGDPISKVQIVAIRKHLIRGMPTTSFSTAALSDRDGNYVVDGLSDGHYYIRAVIHDKLSTTADEGVEFGYAATFYPGVRELDSATPVAVQDGVEVSGVDIRLAKVPLVQIKGRVISASGAPVPGASVMLADESGSSLSIAVNNATNTGQDGTFELKSTPGQSQLFISAGKETNTVPLNIAGPQKVVIQLGTTVHVSGKFMYNSAQKVDDLGVSFEPINSLLATDKTVRVSASGQFASDNMKPGRYRVHVEGLPEPAYIESMSFNNHELAGDVIDLEPESSGALEIRAGAVGAVIDGTVFDDSGKEMSLANVLLIPIDSTSPDRFKAAESKDTGAFSISGIAPGDYKVLAWGNGQDDPRDDATSMERLTSEATEVNVKSAEHKTLRLSVALKTGTSN